MIYVLINWLFIAITSYPIGFVSLKLIMRGVLPENENSQATSFIMNEKKYHFNIIRIFLGLAAITAYAELWSLFGGVGFIAVCVLIAVALCILYCYREEIRGTIIVFGSKGRFLAYITLILFFAYGTSRGYMHFDTNLYHAQAIRWIEEYGIVPGLANLHSRFGYNSAEFALNAIYSFRWILGQSLHSSAGFFALLSSLIIVNIKSNTIREPRLSSFVRVALLFYLGIIFPEMISPASDYYAQLLIFDIIVLWLDMLENVEDDFSQISLKKDNLTAAYQGILCIILFYGVTIKLSIGLLLLLAFIPGIYWLKKKNIKAIVTCILSGLVIAIPYFIRNHIISGWILYPSTFIKLGAPNWQVPVGEAKYDAREIGMWGRGITNAEKWQDVTALNWIGNWFVKQGNMDKLLLIATFISAVIIIFMVVLKICEKFFGIKSRAEKKSGKLWLLVILMIGTVFWFISAPLIRYGYAYLIILPSLTVAFICRKYASKPLCKIKDMDISIMNMTFLALLCGTLVFKGKGIVEDIIRTYRWDYYIKQQDYIDGEAFTYEISGVKIYVATDGGQIGYYKFPSSPVVREDIELRGDGLKEGFRKSCLNK